LFFDSVKGLLVHFLNLLHIFVRVRHNFNLTPYDALKLGQFGRWIWVDDAGFVYISKDFLIELKKSYKCNVRDLEELSDLTGWEKKQKRCEKNDKKTTIWVVSTSVTEFFHRLNYIPRPMNSLEFEEYLANRLPKDSIPF
jgi:hypothetical protein